MEELQRRLRELKAERRALEVALAAATLNPGGAPSSDDVVALSVGGQRFVTTRETLTRVPDTFFSALPSGRFEASMDAGGAMFIDRDAAGFSLLLDWLRSGTIPDGRDARMTLLEEADYFAVKPLIEQLEVSRDWPVDGPYATPPRDRIHIAFVSPRQDVLDGRAYIAACVTAALAGASVEEETAARAYYGALHRDPKNPPLEPSPPPDSLLLRSFTNKAHAATFVDTPDDGDMPPLVLAKHRRVLVPGQPSIVRSIGAFKSQLSWFTRDSLAGLNLNGILLAGGACLGPLLRLPQDLVAGYGADPELPDHMEEEQILQAIVYYNSGSVDFNEQALPDGEPGMVPESDDGNIKYATRSGFAGSDIDLFLYGMTDADAFDRVKEISDVL